jgi:group I intron endonuclease
MSAIIYLLTNTINGKQYVGQTSVGLDERWRRHCRYARRGNPQYLCRAIRKYGPDAFTREILEHTTVEDVNVREIYWISELKTLEHGYNMTEGGEGMRGWVPSEETRAKLRAAKSGENNPMHGKTGKKAPNYGKKFSDEFRAKLSAALSGEKNPQYGRPLTEEARAKISAAMKGKTFSSETIAKRVRTRKLHSRMKRILAPSVTIKSST